MKMEDKLIITPKTDKNNRYKTISLRIDKNIILQIDEISKKTNRSRNEIINMLVQYSMDRYSND